MYSKYSTVVPALRVNNYVGTIISFDIRNSKGRVTTMDKHSILKRYNDRTHAGTWKPTKTIIERDVERHTGRGKRRREHMMQLMKNMNKRT